MNAEKALLKIREKRDEMVKTLQSKEMQDVADIAFQTCMEAIMEVEANDATHVKLDMAEWLKDSPTRFVEPKKKGLGRLNMFYKGAVRPVLVRR